MNNNSIAILAIVIILLTSSAFSGCTEHTDTGGERTVDAPLNILVLPISQFDGNYIKMGERHGTEGHKNDFGYWVSENYSVTYEESSMVQIFQKLAKFNFSSDASATLEEAILTMVGEPDMQEVATDEIGDESWVGRMTNRVLATDYQVYYVIFRIADVMVMFGISDSTLLKSTVVDHAQELAYNLESAVVEK